MKIIGWIILGLNILAICLGNANFATACSLVSFASFQFLLILISYKTVNAFHALRSAGAMGDLHPGSAPTEEIFRSFHVALLRGLYLPLTLVGLGLMINRPMTGHTDDFPLYASMMAFLFVAQFPAIKWVSMFFGFSERNKTTAFLKAVSLVLFLPYLFLPFTGWSILLFIATPPFWYQWGTYKMRKALQNVPPDFRSSSSLKPT